MKHKRNEKINQITPDTLIIGVDIAKERQYACAIDFRGTVLKEKWTFIQSAKGFDQFYEGILRVKHEHQKQDVYVAFEPTGHYWCNLAAFLEDRGIPWLFVNPQHVKQYKGLDDNLSSKNDQKDARLIAKLVSMGNYSTRRDMQEVDHELRTLVSMKERLQKDRKALKGRIRRWLDLYFPEFGKIVKEMGPHMCAILRLVPLPMDVMRYTVEEILALLKERNVKGNMRHATIAQLCALAPHSIGLTTGTEAARMEIRDLVDLLELYNEKLKTYDAMIVEKAKTFPEFDYLVSIKGVSERMVAELLSETGSLTAYQHPRQLLKMAGLTLSSHSSGKSVGRNRISKRGRRRLRCLLYKSINPLINNDNRFSELHTYYKTRPSNPLSGKEASVVLCGKLLKVFYGLAVNRQYYDPDRMIRNTILPQWEHHLAG